MSSHGRFILQEFFSPTFLNMNARAISAGINSNGIPCEGFNQLSLEIYLDYVAATDLTFFIATSPDDVNYGRIQSGSISAGVETLSDRQWSKAISAADKRFTVNLPLNYRWVRIESLDGTSASTDTVTIYATLGKV